MMAVPCEMLLHPELLSNVQLVHLIKQRQLRIPNVERMSRDELLELFHNYCVPYGQRKYRDSGRGKILNKTRHMSPEPVKSLNLINNTQSRKVSHSNCERLKPPPDLLSGHMKRIKIENNVVVPSKPINKDFNVNKRKMSVDMTPVSDSPPQKKDKKPITWP